jgi:hypothetical protein
VRTRAELLLEAGAHGVADLVGGLVRKGSSQQDFVVGGIAET